MAVFDVSLTDGVKVSGYAEIDFNAYAEALFDKTCEAVLSRTQMSAQEREAFETQTAAFTHRLEDIRNIADKRLRDTALDAAALALALGFYHAGNGEAAREIHTQFSSTGGKESGASRGKRAKLWQDFTAEGAKSMRSENPSFSQEALADLIIQKAAKMDIDIPGRKSVVDHLRRMEREGQLSRRRGRPPRRRSGPLRK
jgi:hypothetical protein